MEFGDVMAHFNKVCNSYKPSWDREECEQCPFYSKICDQVYNMEANDKEKRVDPDFWRNIEEPIMAAQPAKAADVTLRDLIQLFLVEYDLDDIVQNPNFDIKRSK